MDKEQQAVHDKSEEVAPRTHEVDALEITPHITYTPEEGLQTKRKIDLILLPLLCGCYIFSFLDKTLLNYSSIFGLNQALGLTGSMYSWTGSIFYFGYLLGSMFWSKLVQRFPHRVGKFISGAVFIWSCIIMLTPLVSNFAGLMVNRFFLGLMESITGPIFVIVTSNWWTREEHAFRTAFWLGGTPVGNFIGGCLSYALGSIQSSISTWKIFFIFFGSFSLAFSIVLAIFMPDNQKNCWWLNDRQKQVAVERVRANQNVSSEHHWNWKHFWETFRDPQTAMFFISAIGNTMPSTFASQFSSQIVKGFGFTAQQTTIISTCPAATIQLSSFLIFSYIASHKKNVRLWIALFTSIPPLIGASLLYTLPSSNTAGRLSGYYLTYTHTVSFTMATGLMASNYAGHTKKTTASGIIFMGWAAGLIAGPQFFLDSEAPNFKTAFEMLMVCYALMIILPLVQMAWYRRENRRRDKLHPEQVHVEDLEFTDQSDFEQWRTFRYAM